MKRHYVKNLSACISMFAILMPLFYFIFKVLPGSGVEFQEFINRFSQWKPEILKGAVIIVIYFVFILLLGAFIVLSWKEYSDD
jgi:hypothetical protein